jgi:hypothetical protein
MAIIEFVHVKLVGGLTVSDPVLRQNMQKVTEVIEGYNHLRTLLYAEVDNPSALYVIGAWESQEQHQKGFSGSPDQAMIMELVKDQMDIDWSYYLDLEQSTLPLDAPILEMKKYILPTDADKEAFSKALVAGGQHPKAGSQGSIGGWNLPKSDGEEAVWVQFTGWKTVDEYANAGGDDRAIESLVEKVDVKYATRVHLW